MPSRRDGSNEGLQHMFYIYKKINYSLIISVDLFLLGAPLESLRNPGK